MKTTFLYYLLLLPLLLTAQTTDTIRKYYPNGQTSVLYYERDGQATGRWLEWYPDGTLRFDADWKDGKGHGLWRYFHPNGRVASETVYDADRPVGLALEYYDNGSVETKTSYLQGRRQGRSEFYLPDGRLERVEYYIQGELDVRTPRVFAPGVISTPENDEYALAFSPGQDTLYLTRREPGGKQRIYLSLLVNGRYTAPAPAPFSTNRDEGAAPSRDGRYLIFASYRTTGAPKDEEALMDMNLWRVNRTPTGWSAPSPLGSTINKERQAATPWPNGYEAGPALTTDGTLYYWTASPEGGSPDLFRAERRPDGSYAPGEPLSELNTAGSESGAALSPDGQLIVFSAYGRDDGFGGEDLYCARWRGDRWGTPVNLGPVINTTDEEGGAYFSPDGRHLYFSRGGENRQADIYYVGVRHLLVGEK